MSADDRAKDDEEQPWWPINIDVIGLPGSERHPKRISVDVNGHTHVGNLCDTISRQMEVRIDWSNYSLWWPKHNVWLLNGSFTLDNWEISAQDVLEYTPRTYPLQIILPDMQAFMFHLDFSKRVFEVVRDICRKLFIRRPEELSLYRPTSPLSSEKDGKKSQPETLQHNSSVMAFHSHPEHNLANKTIEDLIVEHGISTLEKTPFQLPPESTLRYLPCTKKIADKVKLSSGWLSSAISLMQQEVRSGDVLMLRFKYFTNIDLDLRKDSVRINQLYEQLRMSILHDDSDLNVEEAVVLAGVMYQVNSQSSLANINGAGDRGKMSDSADVGGGDDVNELDIENELNSLQLELEGVNSQSSSAKNNLTREPTLQHVAKISRKKDSKLATLGKSRVFYFSLLRFTLTVFDRSVEELGLTEDKRLYQLNVKGCEVSQIGEGSKLKLKLNVDNGSGGMDEYHITIEDVNVYAKLYVALQLAGRGNTMADGSFEEQWKTTREMLQYRNVSSDKADGSGHHSSPKRGVATNGTVDPSVFGRIQVELYLSPRFIKKFKKEAAAQIVNGSGQVSGMGYAEAKKQLIQRWHDVKFSGTQYFNCSIRRGMKQLERGIIGVCRDKLVQLDTKGQDIVQTYVYRIILTWTVNWHKNELNIKLRENNVDLELSLCTLDSKIQILHEYLGGYQFMGTRVEEKVEVDVDMFFKLTYGMKSEEEKIEELQKRDNKHAGLITHSTPNF